MVALSSLPIFAGLGSADLAKIQALLEERRLPPGTVVFEQGAPAEAVYVVAEGEVSVVRRDGSKETELARLGSGDFFGEMGVIDDAPRTARVATTCDTVLLAVKRDDFLRLMAVNPGISRVVLGAVARRAHALAEAGGGGDGGGVVVGLHAASGGVGTSFLCGNLAGALAAVTKGRVAVVDLDLMFGDQAVVLDAPSEKTLERLVDVEDVCEEALDACTVKTRSGVDLLQAPVHPEAAEQLSPAVLIGALESLRHRYDWILCDTAAVVEEFNIHLLEQVQVPLYVVTPDFFSLKNASRWLALMERLGYPVSRVGYVLNKMSPEDDVVIEATTRRFGKPPLGRIPLDPAAARASVEEGRLESVSRPDGPMGRALRELAGALAGVEVPRPGLTSFWRRWIGL